MDIERIKRDLRERLSDYRYLHCLRVADVARELAIIYHYDVDRAYITGLVHDIAKEFTYKENLEVIMKNHLSMDLLSKEYAKMLHSEIGAYLIKDLYGFDDDICHAVSCHTYGSIPMNLLDKIVFVADKIEPLKKYIGIEEEREVAYHNIDKATILCIENYHKKLIREKKKIYPKSLEVLEYLKKVS